MKAANTYWFGADVGWVEICIASSKLAITRAMLVAMVVDEHVYTVWVLELVDYNLHVVNDFEKNEENVHKTAWYLVE